MGYLEQFMKNQKKKMMKNNYEKIEKNIQITFKNRELLDIALTHRSYLNEHKDLELQNNERLEFLGDAVLELIISDYLFTTYIDKPEGDLTNIRAAIVRTESLAEESRKLGFGEFLKMSKGEEDSGGRDKDYLLANTFEAVLGAIYRDQGFEVCKEYLQRTILQKVEHIVSEELYIDPKTQAQELIQAQYKVTPVYEVIKEEGPDHDKRFTVALVISGKRITTGEGTSKQKAEEDAARNAVKKLNQEGDSLK